MTAPRYSIIIPTYNNSTTIQRVVRGVLAAIEGADNVEVIVVDSSDDGTTERLRQQFPRVLLVHPPQRLLPGPARNLGASRAAGNALIFLDGDCLPAPSWFHALRTADAALTGGIVCGAVDLDEPCNLSQFMEYVIWKLAANSAVRRGPYEFVLTENMMIRREDFQATGGFQNSDSANDVQLDVARRAARLAVTFEPAAQVFHIHPRGWRLHFSKLHRIGTETFPLMQELSDYRVGRWTMWLFPIVFLVRWLRITARVLRYRPEWIGRYLLVQPMLWTGLLFYQAGLWRGLGRVLLNHPAASGVIPRSP